jgi:hypothetical protein
MLLHQHRGDCRARIIELGRAVRRFAEKDDALMREPLGEARELVEIAEGFRRLCDEIAEPAPDRLGALRRREQPGGEARALRVDRRLLASGLDPSFTPISGTKATAPWSSSSNMSSPLRRTRNSVW